METKSTDLSFTSIRYYKAKRRLTRPETEKLHEFFQNQDGVISMNLKPNGISVEFYGQVISETFIREMLQRIEFPFAPEPRSGRVKRFLERLAETNRKTYGNKHLDCCGLSQK